MTTFKGFTLIELMAVIAIVGILSVVAVPEYYHYLLKSQMASLSPSVENLRKSLVQYYSQNGKFPSTLSELGFNNPADVNPAFNDWFILATPASSSCKPHAILYLYFDTTKFSNRSITDGDSFALGVGEDYYNGQMRFTCATWTAYDSGAGPLSIYKIMDCGTNGEAAITDFACQ